MLLEKCDFFVVEFGFKVGELMVEIGVYYLVEEVVFKKYLVED